MKYYSEKTKKLYDTAEELASAEETLEKENKEKEILAKKRSERAKEVEEAFKTAYDLRDKFVKDYGSFHYTYKKGNLGSIFDVFDYFF